MNTNASGSTAVFRTATHALALLGFALVIINVGLISNSRALQQQVMARQSALNDAARANNLAGQIVQLIAKTAVDKGDAQLRDLLASQGIKVDSKPQAGAPDAAVGKDKKNSK